MVPRGVNVDPLNPAGAPDPLALKALHFNAVRLVMRPGGQVEAYAKACKDAGLFVLGVEANESGGFMIANADLYQIGNEPDGQPPSSWVMSPADYIELWDLYHGTYPSMPMIAGGLCSGDPAWWARIAPELEGCRGVAVHPYGKTITETKALLAQYRALTPNLGVYVTEWNRPAGEIAGYDWWLRTNTNGAWWFCWSDAMVDGFGLVNPSLAAFAPAVAPPPPPPPPVVIRLDQKPVPNYWPGRPSGAPIGLVIHTMSGTLAATDNWFANPASQVSAHYGVGLDGRGHQYVRLDDRAWANGILEVGNHWPGPPGVNPNDLTVSIETEDLSDPTQIVSQAQYDAVLAIAQQALAHFPSLRYLLGHHAISPSSRPNCPGNRWVASGRFAQLAEALKLVALP